MLSKTRIQRGLIEICEAQRYYVVSYIGNKPQNIDPSISEYSAPATVRANELESAFAIDARNGRSLSLNRTEWSFQVRMTFAKEVSLEAAELSLMTNPPMIPGDPSQNVPSMRVILERVRYIHPVQQQSASGTDVSLAFRVSFVRL